MDKLISAGECRLNHGRRYLIGQLGSFGDCLYATTVARQLKADEPDCHVTWAIGSLYRSILDENPYVDAIWEVPIHRRDDMLTNWKLFSDEAQRRKEDGEFDTLFLTQVFPGNLRYFDGTLRSSIFRVLKRPITVPVAPVVVLGPEEVAGVQKFAVQHGLNNFQDVILFESSPLSSQSFVDYPFAEKVAKLLVGGGRKEVCVIMSAKDVATGRNPQIIDGSELTFRQNAEITKYCTLFVGCSSGLSWLCTSEWAKPLPMLILLGKNTDVYASMVHDHEYFHLPTDHIIEMTDCDAEHVVECVSEIIAHGIQQARSRYYKPIYPSLHHYFGGVVHSMLNGMSLSDALQSIKHTARRYGYIRILLLFARYIFNRVRMRIFIIERNDSMSR